jgi:hypothetical protein
VNVTAHRPPQPPIDRVTIELSIADAHRLEHNLAHLANRRAGWSFAEELLPKLREALK